MINSIFYYVETKAEYIQKVSNGDISARTIVFVEDTGEIFKNGKMFSNYRQLVESLDVVKQELLQLIEDSTESLKVLISNLRNYVNSVFDEELETISGQLESYETLLLKLREEFSTLKEDLGEAKTEINNLKGLIREYASWKSATTGTLTTLQSLLDALNGVISLHGTLINTLKNSVINYESKVDLIEGSFHEYLEQYDITEKVKEIIGREILLKTGILHDFATKTDVNNQFRTSIDEWFDALSPSWTLLTSQVQKGQEAYDALAGFSSSIETIDGKITSLTNQFSSWNSSYSNFLSGLQTSANEDGSFFHLIANGNIGLHEIAADIFGEANADGSNITIKADKVYGLGDWIFEHATVKDLVAGNSPNKIFINSTDGIRLEKNTFVFNTDGSGQIAGGKIAWDVNGDVTINGKIVGISNISGMDGYWNFLSSLQTSANEDGSFFHLIANGNVGLYEVAANIFGEANADGSSITIKADKVYGLGDWIFEYATVKDLVAGSSPNRIFINSVDGIRLETDTFVFNTDGSGQIAGGKISWDTNGNITINGKIVGINNINGLDGYWEDKIGVTIGDWGNGTLKDYIDSGLSGKISNGELNTIRQRITALEGNTYYDIDELTTTLTNTLGTRIASAESSITKLNSFFTYDGNGNVTGLKSEIDITSKVLNYINNDTALSNLRTWAQSGDGQTLTSSGFDLRAEIKNVAGEVVNSAYITATVTDDLLSRVVVNADRIMLNGSDQSIGKFVRAYGKHFLCWNFDLVYPEYYAFRRYLLNVAPDNHALAKTLYDEFASGQSASVLRLKDDFTVATRTSEVAYTLHPSDLNSKACIMMDWAGMVFLKDYTYDAERTDTSDHNIADPLYLLLYPAHYDTIPGTNELYENGMLRLVPTTPPNATSVSMSAAKGCGLIAWGKIKWGDVYKYKLDPGGSGREVVDAQQVTINGQNYYKPILLTTDGLDYDGTNGTPLSEANGALIITDAYLVNPKIINPSFKFEGIQEADINNPVPIYHNSTINVPKMDVL